MVNAKKDKKFKQAKKEKKLRKRANKTAITLTSNKKDKVNPDNNLWERRIPLLPDDNKPKLFDFTNDNQYLIELWDRQQKEDQMALLNLNRSHLVTMLKEQLGIENNQFEEHFPEPPRKDVAIYQAKFLQSLQKYIKDPPKDVQCRVQLHSLSEAAHLNNQYAQRMQYDEPAGRWQVQLESNGKFLSIKEENFNVLPVLNPRRGYNLLPPEPTVLNFVVFEILKDRLNQLSVMEGSCISTWALLLYILFTYSPTTLSLSYLLPTPIFNTWMIFCSIYLFITFQSSPECEQLRTMFLTTTQRTLCQDRSSTEHMKWKSDSYLSACLLMLMVRSSSTLFIVMYLIVVPYIMFILERCSTKEDRKCFNRMRVSFSWINKFILLYYGWHVSYWALLTVCVVVFTNVSKLLFGMVLYSIAYLMSNGRNFFGKCLTCIDKDKTIENVVIKYNFILFIISFSLSSVSFIFLNYQPMIEI